MSREWMPGDVAMVGGMRALYTDGNIGPEYHFADGSCCRAEIVPASGPLVVIDPEDREQVEQFVRIYSPLYFQEQVDRMQAALREFANPTPPKPAEPTGLGAVVVDRDGSVLVRVNNEAFPWRATGGHRFSWDQVDHLTTLSEGAEPMADWEIDLLRGES